MAYAGLQSSLKEPDMPRRLPEPAPQLRREMLRQSLPATAVLLAQRRASDIAEGLIDDYVALNWLEWNGGGLRLTTTGDNIRRQLLVRPASD